MKTAGERIADYFERIKEAAFVVVTEVDSDNCPTKWYAVWANGQTEGFGQPVIVLNRIPTIIDQMILSKGSNSGYAVCWPDGRIEKIGGIAA